MYDDNLPLDITEAILLRLPVKSVGRFKCVSKTWNSLIHDPHFVKKHLHHTTSRSLKASNLILLSSNSYYYYLIDVTQLLPYLNSDDIIDISATAKEIFTPPPFVNWAYHYGSCNGLVLVEDVEDGDDAVFLWNPTTQEIWEIPANPIPLPFRKSLVLYGFGYVPQDDDYKIVSMSFWEYVDSTDMHDFNIQFMDMFVSVYSLRNNSWRKLPNIHFKGVRRIASNHVLINQNLHLLYSPRSSAKLFAFSLANEEFNEIKLPVSVESDRAGHFYNLVDLGGKLGVLSYLSEARCCLHVMEEYGVCESWTKLCVFGDDQMPNPRCLVEGSSHVIVLGDEYGIFAYNIDEKRRRNMRIKGGSSGFFVRGTYVESLESPKRIFTTPP